MENQKLVKYVKEQLAKKKDEKEIIKKLEETGWDYADIVEALTIVKKQIKLKKLIFRYVLSIAIVIAVFIALHFITDYLKEGSKNIKTSQIISVLNSSAETESNHSELMIRELYEEDYSKLIKSGSYV